MRTTKRFLQHLLVALLFVGAPLLAGCDSGGDDDDDNGGPGGFLGSFDAEINGDGFSEELDGNAWFWSGEDPDTGQEIFYVWMSPTQNQQVSNALWFATLSDRPGTGTYQFINFEEGDIEDAINNQFASWLYSEANYFTGTGGELTITSSSSSRVQGTFSFSALGFNTTTAEELAVTVSGSFNAVGFEGQFPIPTF